MGAHQQNRGSMSRMIGDLVNEVLENAYLPAQGISIDPDPNMDEATLTTWEVEIGSHLDVLREYLASGADAAGIAGDLLDVIRHVFEHGYVLDVHIRREGER